MALRRRQCDRSASAGNVIRCCRYSEWEPWILRNLSFTIAPGQSVALVGPSGCGKTTLAKIVLGLLAPQEGEVTVTEQPRPVCRSAIPAEGMAAVMQDDCLFSGTMADNVAFFDSSAELSEIEAAARAAGIHDDIHSEDANALRNPGRRYGLDFVRWTEAKDPTGEGTIHAA
ncbi:ATP-binding cassette domain-containing protein [Xanthomonas oryzae pv. oryzae]|nr:ATP-binding cassette domain-containing protein [Xanthomonas oryzae]